MSRPHPSHPVLAVSLGSLLLAAILAPPASGSAQEARRSAAASEDPGLRFGRGSGPQLEAVRIPGDEPRIDGRLSDPAWDAAEVATDFVQLEPDPGAPPSRPTEVRLLYTGEAIFVGARMHHLRPGSVVTRLSRRDEQVIADRIAVGFDSYRDRRTAFVFGVTAAGVQSDHVLHDDTRVDRNWDAVWESAVRVDSAGWTAEIRIPLSQLRYTAPDGSGDTSAWGLQFQRTIARLDETVQWAPYPADGSRKVSAFGTLTGLRDLDQSPNLEVRPYTVLRAGHAPVEPGNPFREPTEIGAALGGDVSYGLSPNMTLNATVNPDFGQVEADPSVVNLSAFETRLPEKRPFFQEGADIFRFDLGTGPADGELFYSRRIGRKPRGSAPSKAAYATNPEATTILGAGKVSGKTTDGWSLGLLTALTATERARWLGPDSETPEAVVTEPMAGYGVARAIRDFRDGDAALGAVLTGVVRDVSARGAVAHLPRRSLAGGIDGRIRFGGSGFQLEGHLLGSSVGGSREAVEALQTSPAHFYQRPDAGHLSLDPARRSLDGLSASLALEKVGGGHWGGSIRVQTRTPGFEVNDLGFQQEADYAVGSAYLSYRSLGPDGPFRRWNAYVNGWQGWTYGGERIENRIGMGGSAELRNQWSVHLGLGLRGSTLSPTELRGGPALRQSPGLSAGAFIESDPRSSVSYGLRTSWETEVGAEGTRLTVGPNVIVRPDAALSLTLGPTMTWNRDGSQYVATVEDVGGEPETRYLFSRLEQRTASLTLRLDYTVSPSLSIQFYGEPFVSAGGYTEFRLVQSPRARRFSERFRPIAPEHLSREGTVYSVDRDEDGTADFNFADPDYHLRRLRSNLVLRWEYRPGSRLFLAWSQARSGRGRPGRFDLATDAAGIFDAPARDVLLLKMEHWLSF